MEPFIEGATVYLDLNNDGKLDPGDPFQVTKQNAAPNSIGNVNYNYFTFSNLQPGTYTVRTILPNGYQLTAPSGSTGFTDTITANGETISNLFGISQTSSPPHQDPIFTTTAPALSQVSAGQLLRYNANAQSPDASPLTYELLNAPDGMTIDPTTGTVVWVPTEQQVNQAYTTLAATTARLDARGRGAYAPTVVEYDPLVVAEDNQGGKALQYLTVDLLPLTYPPSFTSTFPSTAQPQVGKQFTYQVTAVSPNPTGGKITFGGVGLPKGATIDPQTGLLTWTPTSGELGNQQFTITATDGTGAESMQLVNVTVVNPLPAVAPVITSTPGTRIRIGATYSYKVTATDTVGDLLTYALVKAPQGLTLTGNVIAWTPTASQSGDNNVVVKVTNSEGQSVSQSFTINASNNAELFTPVITSTPNLVTNIEQEYEYNLQGSDPNGEAVVWSLDTAPSGVVIDAQTGALRWQPNETQLGEQTISVRLTDSDGLYSGQEYTLSVLGTNEPPLILSNPITSGAINQKYTYNVVGKDPQNEGLTYGLSSAPSGMGINPQTGLITWTPGSTGTYNVGVIVTDTQGGSVQQTYKVVVGTSPIYLPPRITSNPGAVAGVGSPYTYNVQATDPQGQQLTYQLIDAGGATGMKIDPNTGVLTWTNPVLGNYQVIVGAVDTSGLAAAQGFTLTARANTPPVISSTPGGTIYANQAYRYDIQAVDPQGGQLTYSIDKSSTVPQGLSLDSQGRLSWTPTASQAGSYSIELDVTNSLGTTTSQTVNLNVALDTVAPEVTLIANNSQVNLGDEVDFQARATDNVQVANLQVLINGQAVVIDANGIARVNASAYGTITGEAISTDEAGNTAQAEFDVAVIDPTNTDSPVVSLDLSSIPNDVVTAPTNILGTVTGSGIEYYTLSIAPVSSSDFQQIARVDNPRAINDGVLGQFDPTLLENGSYTLRLTAYNTGGSSSSTDDTISVAGNLKLGNFHLSFTDLSIPVTGIPITLTRSYDSLTANESEEFGYGWRLDFRDTDLQTSVGQPTGDTAELGGQNPFKNGTRVYITLPGGTREGFTFTPIEDKLSQLFGDAGLSTGAYTTYDPAFVADAGVTDTLTVQDATIQQGLGTDGYYGVSGDAYNPADSYFGGIYTLTTKEGIVYQIDAESGKLLSVTDNNGNKLTYTDAGIYSSTGQDVTFGRDAQGRITSVTDPLGKEILYGYDSQGNLISMTDRDGNVTKFVYDSTHAHYLDQVIDPLGRTGERSNYDANGRLEQIIDANGKPVNLTYDPTDSKETVTDALGNPTTYVYDDHGNVLTKVDALGGITTNTYDDNNNLLSTVDPDGVSTTYTYDSQGNRLSIADQDGNTTNITYNQYGETLKIVSPGGLTVSSTYDGQGNLLSRTSTDGQTTSFTYDDSGRVIQETAPDGEVSTYAYDALGNPTLYTDSHGNETISTYDADGQVLTLSMVYPQENQTLTTSYTYDSQGNITSVTDAEGNTSTTEYDAKGEVTATTDARGNVTQYFYDAKGEQVKVIEPDNTPNNPNDNPVTTTEYDADGNVIAQTSATGLTTRYVYDALGQLTETILPDLTPNNPNDNPVEKTEYTPGGRVKATVDIYGTETDYTYNQLGQVSQEIDYYGNSAGNKTTYTYNSDGQVTSVTDPRNRTTLYTIDNEGKVTQTTYFDGTTSSVTYDALGRTQSETNQLGETTSYQYNAFGQVSVVTNALNQQTDYTYNDRGSLEKVTDALGHSTTYQYDQYNRQTAVVDANGDTTTTTYDQYGQVASNTDADHNTTEYTYDNLGELTSVKLANQATTTYTYDNLGRLIQVEDANQNVTTYEYDAFNRKIATDLPLGQRSTTTYNNLGEVATTTDFDGNVITYSYDQYGRLADKSFSDPQIAEVSYTYDPVTSQVKTVTDGRGVTTYGFDSYDRVNLITNPDGQTVGYTYDVLGNLTALTTSGSTVDYTYDALNRLSTVNSGGQLAQYSYDAVGNLISTTLADGTTETRQYDASNRLTGITTVDASGTVLSSYAYTLDGVGDITQVVENTGRTVNYTYDDVNQLKLESITDPTLGNRTISYDYDLVGNRLDRNDSDPSSGLTTYVYDNNNRLISQTDEGVVTTYTYDNNGSMLSSSDGTNSVVYKWIDDGDNRLVGVTTTNASGTSQIEYVYDTDGNRVASITDGVRTNYLVDPSGYSKVLQDYNVNGQIVTTYIYGLGLIESVSGGSESFYHSDALGSTRLLTNASGQVTDRYIYDAFGRLLAHAGGSSNSYQFTGEQTDSTGLDYLRARYYNSDLGRFISKDSFAGTSDSPITQNPYVYGNNNPVNNTDPSGHDSLGEFSVADAISSILDSLDFSAVGQAALQGAVFGLAYGLIKEDAQLLDGRSSEVSWSNVLQSTYTGAAFGIAFGGAPILAVAFSAAGFANAIGEARKGQFFSAIVDASFALGPFAFKEVSEPVIKQIEGILDQFNAGSSIQQSSNSIKVSDSGITLNIMNPCFIAGTYVLTTNGERRIEDLLIGDTVISGEPTSGKIASHVIKNIFVSQVSVVLDIRIGTTTITCSPEHPFWVYGIGWQAAKNLTSNDLLLNKEGNTVGIDSIIQHQGSFTVYNIEVDGFHTYYVSTLGILVHNKAAQNSNIGGVEPDPNVIQNSSNTNEIAKIIIDDNQFGKKIGKHTSDFGGNPSNPEDRALVRDIIEDISNNPDIVVPGNFSGQGPGGKIGPVYFRIKGSDVVITKADGETFVSILKDGINNKFVQQALEENK